MDALFLKILNMSINASWLVLAVVVLRLLLQKAPKATNVVMWALVAVRLICPFSIESIFSLIPSAEPISLEPTFSNPLTNYDRIPVFNLDIKPLEANASNSFSLKEFMIITVAEIWTIGIFIMLLYTVISYWRVHKRVREAIPLKDNIYLCDHISTPFIFGIIHPKIYLPSSIGETDMEYVVAHEQAHLKRHDHWWKPLGFLLLIINWFNPLIWLAYILLCRDIELACDEKVIEDMGIENKKPYSNALINCSVPNKMLTACPLAFGEIGVKKRVKTVLNYKKPALWISTTAVVACVAVAVCFLTNPVGMKIDKINDKSDYSYLFKDVNSLSVLTSNQNSSFKIEDVDSIVKNLKKVRLDPTPISLSRSEARDKTYQIIVDEYTTLCFNQNLSEVWLYDSITASYSYTVKNPDAVKKALKQCTSLDITNYDELYLQQGTDFTENFIFITGGIL